MLIHDVFHHLGLVDIRAVDPTAVLSGRCSEIVENVLQIPFHILSLWYYFYDKLVKIQFSGLFDTEIGTAAAGVCSRLENVHSIILLSFDWQTRPSAWAYKKGVV